MGPSLRFACGRSLPSSLFARCSALSLRATLQAACPARSAAPLPAFGVHIFLVFLTYENSISK